VKNTRLARILLSSQPTACHMSLFKTNCLQTGKPEVCLEDQTIVSGAQNDSVVFRLTQYSFSLSPDFKCGIRGSLFSAT